MAAVHDVNYSPPDPFQGRDHLEFTTYEGQVVSLHREAWQRKVVKHWNQYLAFNFEKIELTLSDPDCVMRSQRRSNSLLYFKSFSHYYIRPGIEVPTLRTPYFLVVVKQGSIVQSCYFVQRIKEGERIWPR